MVCMTSCPVIVNAGCSARPALHARTRASSCVARSSSEYPSSSWPRGRVDTSTCVQAHALASTVARETEAPTEHALSDAELIERRRLLEGSYLAETAPEPEVASTSWSEKAMATEDARSALPGAAPFGTRLGRSRSADSSAGRRSRSTSASRRRVHRRTVLRRKGLRRLAADALACTPEGLDARLLRRLKRALRQGQGGEPGTSEDNLKAFINTLGNTQVLQREAEAALGDVVRKGAVAKQRMAAQEEQLGRAPTLAEAAAEQGLHSAMHLQLLLANAAAAHTLLVQHNLRLVISIAKRFSNRGVDMADMVQDGLVGLSKSIDKFCVEKGNRFSTYASWWIRQSISRGISERSRVVRLPVHIYEAFARISRVRDELKARHGKLPSDEEVGALLGLPAERVAACRRQMMPSRSLEQPLQPGSDWKNPMLWGDRLVHADADEGAADALGGVRADINAALGTLQPRERNVVRMRYGLHRPDGQAMSLHDISAAYGLSKERIRQIEEAALGKLRLPWRRTLLRAGALLDGLPEPASALELAGPAGAATT